MKKDINILIANPAGNITIFVLDDFSREEYQAVATKLLAIKELKGEQVAFIKEDGTMEMCGLEFCGNASRAFALMTAINRGINGYTHIDVNVSGCDETLSVAVDTTKKYTQIKMPNPLNVFPLNDTGIDFLNDCIYVDLGGISHVVLNNVDATTETFVEIKNYINKRFDPPAMGVMFFDTAKNKLTPVVYVKDVDTTYFEGSCGSGSTAVAIAFSLNEQDGTYKYTLHQPAGTITSTVEKHQGQIDAVYIEGPVELSKKMTVTIDL